MKPGFSRVFGIVAIVLLAFCDVLAGFKPVGYQEDEKTVNEKLQALHDQFEFEDSKANICNSVSNNVVSQTRVDCIVPGYFFRNSNRQGSRALVGGNSDRTNPGCEEFSRNYPKSGIFEIDLETGKFLGLVTDKYSQDAVPLNDKYITFPTSKVLNFYARSNDSDQKNLIKSQSVLDVEVRGAYQSVGKISDSEYRMLTDQVWFGGQSQYNRGLASFEVEDSGGALKVSKGLTKTICDDRNLSLPMISKDGSKVVAYDVDLESTVVLDISNNNCTLTHNLGFRTGKADFSFDGNKIAFAYTAATTEHVYSKPESHLNLNIVVLDLKSNEMSMVTNNDRNSYFPSFREDGNLNFYEIDEFDNVYIVTANPTETSKRLPTQEVSGGKCLPQKKILEFFLGDLMSHFCGAAQILKPSLPDALLRYASLDKRKCQELVSKNWKNYKQTLARQLEVDKKEKKATLYNSLGVDSKLVGRIKESELQEICSQKSSAQTGNKAPVLGTNLGASKLNQKKIFQVRRAFDSLDHSVSNQQYIKDLRKVLLSSDTDPHIRVGVLGELSYRNVEGEAFAQDLLMIIGGGESYSEEEKFYAATVLPTTRLQETIKIHPSLFYKLEGILKDSSAKEMMKNEVAKALSKVKYGVQANAASAHMVNRITDFLTTGESSQKVKESLARFLLNNLTSPEVDFSSLVQFAKTKSSSDESLGLNFLRMQVLSKIPQTEDTSVRQSLYDIVKDTKLEDGVRAAAAANYISHYINNKSDLSSEAKSLKKYVEELAKKSRKFAAEYDYWSESLMFVGQ